jgi:glycosyltransferase involved in cell wall biosynthesis
LLLDALESFQSTSPCPTHLVFIGDGEDAGKLKAAAASRGLSDSVTVTGFVDPPTVASYLQSADVFVLGSQKEGWCTALVEAMACGCRMVSTPVSSASEIITEGINGRIASSGNPAHFADLVRETLVYPLEQVHAHNGKAVSRYDLAHLAPDLSELWPVLSEGT